MDSNVTIKETKKRIQVDYEGKPSLIERLKRKFSASYTWIKILINIFRFLLMLGISFVIIYPFVSKIAGSFMTKEDIIDSTVALIPKHFTLDTYKYLITENGYLTAFTNTLILSLVSAIIQTFVACLVGYGLAKFKFKGNKLIMGLVVLTMVIPHSTLELAMLLHFSDFDLFYIISTNAKGGLFRLILGHTLELTNSFTPLFILSLGGIAFKNGLYIYMMRQFFKGVPDELEESAYVDGSGVFRTFFQIIIPLSVPMMITIFLFSFSWQWTDEFYTTLFFPNPNVAPILMPRVYSEVPFSLRTDYIGKSLYETAIRNTAGIMIIMPLVVLYLFCQKYLVQGIERSGLVG